MSGVKSRFLTLGGSAWKLKNDPQRLQEKIIEQVEAANCDLCPEVGRLSCLLRPRASPERAVSTKSWSRVDEGFVDTGFRDRSGRPLELQGLD